MKRDDDVPRQARDKRAQYGKNSKESARFWCCLHYQTCIVVSIMICLSYSSPIGYTDGYGKVTDVWEHLNIGRMYGYDGTFYKSTTQGWMGNKCPTGERDETKRVAVLFLSRYLYDGNRQFTKTGSGHKCKW